jgi:hypothetical protein
MKKHIFWLIFFALFCNKLPIGEDELNLRGDFAAQYVDFVPYFTATEYKNIPLGSSSNLVVGKNSNYESRILLKFNFPSSFEQGLDEIKLILYRNNNLENDTVSFSIHLLTESFDEAEATWYHRTEIDDWHTAGGDYQVDSLRVSKSEGDSLVVSFNYIELEQIKAAPGLIIIPHDSGFVGFYSQEGGKPPVIRLVKNEEITILTIDDDCHILTGPAPYPTDNWIGSGMAYRNYVKFLFDTLLVDDDDKKVVFAELTVKPHEVSGMRDSIEIAVRRLLEPLDDFDTQTGSLIDLKKCAIDDTLFTLDIVNYVQMALDYPDSNFGFFIYLSPENYDISTVKFEAASHHLTVGYILPPDER